MNRFAPLLFVPLASLWCALLCWEGEAPAEPVAPAARQEPRPPNAGAEKKPNERGTVKLSDEALAIHREALVIDGHNDLPYQFREKNDLSFDKIDLRKPQKDKG